jgi:hypothetical protein
MTCTLLVSVWLSAVCASTFTSMTTSGAYRASASSRLSSSTDWSPLAVETADGMRKPYSLDIRLNFRATADEIFTERATPLGSHAPCRCEYGNVGYPAFYSTRGIEPLMS